MLAIGVENNLELSDPLTFYQLARINVESWGQMYVR